MLGSLTCNEIIVQAKKGLVLQGPGRFEKIYGERRLLPDVPFKVGHRGAEACG